MADKVILGVHSNRAGVDGFNGALDGHGWISVERVCAEEQQRRERQQADHGERARVEKKLPDSLHEKRCPFGIFRQPARARRQWPWELQLAVSTPPQSARRQERRLAPGLVFVTLAPGWP